VSVLGIAWVVVWAFVGVIVLLAFVLTTWALHDMWRRGDRGWAIATIILPLVVTWALWVISESQ
jgi:hypothetical protein